MKIAFFDTKDYDRIWFEKLAPEYGYEFVFYDTRCTEDTAILASGCDAVCVFVNCVLNKKAIDKLYVGEPVLRNPMFGLLKEEAGPDGGNPAMSAR